MNFAYYPGCSARGSSADYEKSTQAVCKALNMNLVDIPDWSCCGSTPAHAVSSELSAALCVRNLDIAAQQQADLLLTPCPSCLSNLRMASKRMEDPQFRARVDELLDGPAAEKFPPVTSVMQGIAGQLDMDAIASRVRKSLKGLKLAAYYGCLMSRPAEIMDFGDPENPTLMESMLAACGAEMVDFPLKTSCCGASFGIPERSMTARNTRAHPRPGHTPGRGRGHCGLSPLPDEPGPSAGAGRRRRADALQSAHPLLYANAGPGL